MSPYEELHGKKAVERRVEFGELIYYSTPKKGRAKLDLRWKIGVYLGHAWDSNELFCGTKLGNVKKARSAVRVVEGSRWNLKAVDRVIGTPGRPKPVDDGELTADEVESGEAPHEFRAEDVDPEQRPEAAEAAQDATAPDDPPTADELRAAKRIRITLKDVKQYGYTAGCPRCAALEFGLGHTNSKVAHNDECRRRF